MNFSIIKNNRSGKIEILIYVLALVILLLLAFGKFNRVTLIHSLAIADNLEVSNQLYPSINSESPGFYSSYFPGLAYFINFIKGSFTGFSSSHRSCIFS